MYFNRFSLRVMENLLKEKLKKQEYSFASSLNLLARLEVALGAKIISSGDFADFMTLCCVIHN